MQEVDRFFIRYPKLFQGLGTIQGEYCISLQEEAKPFALSAPQRVPLPLMPKFKLEISYPKVCQILCTVKFTWLRKMLCTAALGAS